MYLVIIPNKRNNNQNFAKALYIAKALNKF